MRQRRLIIGGLLIWLVLLMWLIFSHTHHQPKKVDLFRAATGGTNIQFPYLASQNTVNFFTGSNFASYDTKNQTTQAISPQFIFPTVNLVRWSKNGILLQTSNDYTPVDNFYTALNQKGLSTGQEYWWIYNYATQKMDTVLPQNTLNNVTDAFWNSSGNSYCYVSSDGWLYVSSSPKHGLSKVGPNAKIKQFSGSTISIMQGAALKQIDTTSGKEKTLTKATIQDAYVSPDNQTVAYVVNNHPQASSVTPGILYKINPANGKSSKLLDNFNGPMAGNGGNLYVGYADNAGINHLQLYPKTGKTIAYTLGTSLNKGDSIGSILPVDSHKLYIVSNTNNIVEVTDSDTTFTTPVSNKYKIQTDLYESGYEIHYDPYKDTYEIDISSNPFLANQAAALQFIKSQGIDPNQINIIWRAYDGVDNTNPSMNTAKVAAPITD